MSRPDSGRSDDQTRDLIERFEREFGRRPGEGVTEQQTNAFAGFSGGAPRPMSPPGAVRLRLPLNRPRLVYVILAVNVLMYGVTLALTLAGDSFNVALYRLGAKFGPAIDAGQYWRFLTPIVLHGGLLHLGFNSYALYALGPDAERFYGTARFLAIYLLGGLAGSIASYVWSPSLSIGASGAIFGLIGALAAFFYVVRTLIGAEASRQQVTQLISMVAINIVFGLSVPAIDNAAHMGGLVAGTIAGLALAPRFAVDDRLYPPVVVRTDRAALSWLWASVILVALIALAAIAISR